MSVPRRTSERPRRLWALGALVVVIATGLFVHTTLPDNAATDIAGDALYACAAYAGIVMIAPRMRTWAVGATSLGWCVAVELFQLTGVPVLVADSFRPAVLVLGTVFEPRDLLIYTVSIVVACTIDAALHQARRR